MWTPLDRARPPYIPRCHLPLTRSRSLTAVEELHYFFTFLSPPSGPLSLSLVLSRSCLQPLDATAPKTGVRSPFSDQVQRSVESEAESVDSVSCHLSASRSPDSGILRLGLGLLKLCLFHSHLTLSISSRISPCTSFSSSPHLTSPPIRTSPRARAVLVLYFRPRW